MRWIGLRTLLVVALCLVSTHVFAQAQGPSDTLSINGDSATNWIDGDTSIIQVQGHVTITTDDATLTADNAVIWLSPYPGAVIIRGQVPATLAQIASSQICYLSVDMNSAQPEVEAVRQLWPRLVPGGIVLLDDYAGGPAHRHQKQALDKLAGQMRLNILALPTGQGLIFRQPNP